MPNRINPTRMLQGPVLKDVIKRAVPIAMLENMIVLRWVNREEMNPDASRVVKYPKDISRKRDPASAWLNVRSVLTFGISGANIIRAMKFTKKIDVSSKSGDSWAAKFTWFCTSLSLPFGPDAVRLFSGFRIEVINFRNWRIK